MPKRNSKIIAWDRVTVPTHGTWSLKDPALVAADGHWYLLCSAFYDTNESLVVCYRSDSLHDWEGPLGKGNCGNGVRLELVSVVRTSFEQHRDIS